MNSTPKQLADRTEWRNEQGLLHRTDGPAIEWVSGTKSWWINGQLHREDGPAIEWPDGTKQWWINDQRVSTDSEEYLALLASSCLRTFAECCWFWKHLEPEQREPSLQVQLEELADEVQRARLKEQVKKNNDTPIH